MPRGKSIYEEGHTSAVIRLKEHKAGRHEEHMGIGVETRCADGEIGYLRLITREWGVKFIGGLCSTSLSTKIGAQDWPVTIDVSTVDEATNNQDSSISERFRGRVPTPFH